MGEKGRHYDSGKGKGGKGRNEGKEEFWQGRGTDVKLRQKKRKEDIRAVGEYKR